MPRGAGMAGVWSLNGSEPHSPRLDAGFARPCISAKHLPQQSSHGVLASTGKERILALFLVPRDSDANMGLADSDLAIVEMRRKHNIPSGESYRKVIVRMLST